MMKRGKVSWMPYCEYPFAKILMLMTFIHEKHEELDQLLGWAILFYNSSNCEFI